MSLLPREAMHSVDYAVARCLPVRLSHASIVSNRLCILKLFSVTDNHTILCFPHKT